MFYLKVGKRMFEKQKEVKVKEAVVAAPTSRTCLAV